MKRAEWFGVAIVTLVVFVLLGGGVSVPQSAIAADEAKPPTATETPIVPEVYQRVIPSGQGRVVSITPAGRSTYLELDVDGSTVWLASMRSTAAVGNQVKWSGASLAVNFVSKSLDRTFSEIIFASSVSVVPSSVSVVPGK